MTFLHCATGDEQRAKSVGPIPDTNTDGEMNGPTTSVKSTPLERGRAKYTHGKDWGGNLRIGGGGGGGSALEPGLCNGNHMAGDCDSDAPKAAGRSC